MIDKKTELFGMGIPQEQLNILRALKAAGVYVGAELVVVPPQEDGWAPSPRISFFTLDPKGL